MKITVTAAGTRGDVQPCVALGLGLKAAGHDVTLASWEPFRRIAEDRGLEFRAVAGPEFSARRWWMGEQITGRAVVRWRLG